MRKSAPIRFAAAASFVFSTLLPAQSPLTPPAKPAAATLPATPPTTIPEPPPTPAQLPAHPADVTYANNMLTVSASNSSLNQILRDISRLTGMKITGGVTDERVFGQYGPSSPSQILTTLLDGTGSNILFVKSSGTAPSELILTPRQGGATPPNPNAAAMEEIEQREDPGPKQSFTPGQSPPYRSSAFARGEPANSPPSESPPPEPPTSDTSQPQSPNGVKTPQEIFDQLQKLRQQQQQQQQPTTQ